MRKTLASLILFAAALSAVPAFAAAPPCKPATPADVRVGVTFNPSATVNAAWAYWYCVTDVDTLIVWYAATPETFTASLMAQLKAYRDGTAPQFLDTATTLSGEDPKLALAKADAMKAAMADPKRPPAPIWTVAKNGTSLDRPAFTYIANGAKPTSSSGRAPVGAKCDCIAAKLVVSPTTYCQVAAQTIAACTRTGPPISK